MNVNIERIVNTYSDTLLRLAMHYTKNTFEAQDIVQNVFLKLIENPREFESLEHEKAWLLRVCINLCKDSLKSSWKKKVVSINDEFPLKEESYTIDEKTPSLLPHIVTLPPNQKTAIYLFYYQDLSVIEISEIMQANQSTVLSWLKRGRDKLKKIIKEDL